MRGTLAAAAILLAGTLSGAEAEPAAKPSVGKKAPAFQLADFRGKTWSLDDARDQKLVVVAFLGTECPLAVSYAPRLNELAAKYGPRGVAFVGVFSNLQDSLAEIGHFARTQKVEFPLLKDPGNAVADQLGAQRTPEVLVLDAERVVRYHGRIDDQYTYGKQRPQATQNYLTAALDDLLAGKAVATPHAESVGCHIGRVLKPQAGSEVTYSRHISRILNQHCVQCHRPGEIGPFALTNYEEAVGWAEMIREVVQEQRMPPWHASPAHGKFKNDARLSDEEKRLIDRWVSAGAPEGDRADLPPAPKFAEGWQIGEPDLVIRMSERPFQVPATGEVKYRYFVVDPGFTEDRWVQAAECRPGNRAVVHHIIVLARQPGDARQGDERWLSATAPGARPLILPQGMAKKIPAGSRLVFQMHYTPIGTPQEDLSCVGLKFADPKTVQKQVTTDQAATHAFQIPPNASNHKVEASKSFNQDTLVLQFFPHMHLRGKAFRYTAVMPDGGREVLLDIPRYDFAWQNSYVLAEPKRMPPGSRLFCEAWFDNSADNLANPDPSKAVRWGDQTWEEMMIGYFDSVPVDQDLTKALVRRTDAFLEQAQKSPPKLDAKLTELASKAFDSREDLERFGAAMRKVAPQLDRMCWTVVEDNQLQVRQCVQEPQLERQVGGAGRKVPASFTSLAGYAREGKTVLHERLSAARGLDLNFMARAYGSSLHLPLKRDDLPGTLNFWSTEPDAFPPAAVELLEAVAAALQKK